MKPQFPKVLVFCLLIVGGLLAVDAPGYMKFASPHQLANLLPKQASNSLAQPAKDISCAIGNKELDKKLKNFGVQSCRK
jgi:hypothetical protein